MSKIMSMFEKLNLVEKVDGQAPVGNNAQVSKAEVNNDNSKVEEKMPLKEKDIQLSNEDEPATIEPQIEPKSAMKPKFEVEKNMTIEEIYSSYGVENSKTNTVFMLGNFINALPENLPYDVKKASVKNIISASNTDLNKLLLDGENRLNVLGEFIGKYEDLTVNTVEDYKGEIERLAEIIKKYKEQIKIKETKLEEQKYIIKYEAEKINSIIEFFRK
jgi:hypothetical protein